MVKHEIDDVGNSPRSAPYLLFILLASVASLGVLAVSAAVQVDPQTRAILGYFDLVLCVLFFVDFCASLVRAERRWHYLLTWGWLDLLSSIPVVEGLRWARTARVVRILRLLRGIRSAKVLGQAILERRTQSSLLAVGLLILLLLAVGSIGILNVERPLGENANIRTADDALWWAIATVTTVGYGDKYPVSTEGRIIAAILMVAGVGLFGSLSGVVAASVMRPDEKENDNEVSSLRAEIAELRDLLKSRFSLGSSDESGCRSE